VDYNNLLKKNMSFPRLTVLIVAFGAPLLAGGCGVPLAVSAGSYAADGASMVETGKSGTDHFASMVSKKDCALWRVFRNQDICREREGNPNPYNVNYDAPYRSVSDGGTEYMAPPAATTDKPAASWDVSAYNKDPAAPAGPATASPQVPAQAPPQAEMAESTPAPAAISTPPVKAKKAVKARSPVKKKKKPVKHPPTSASAAPVPSPTPSPDPAASAL
jgi:hypothetical protein